MTDPLRLAVLISGSGSNLQALINQQQAINARIAGVISNRPGAYGLERARRHAIPGQVIDHRQFSGREDFESRLGDALDALAPDLIALAGFMRILTPAFVARYEGRMLNIHPSLLPAYRGLHTHERCLADARRWHGCSVHYVTAELDGGPVVLQARVPVLEDDTPQTLQARVQQAEHRAYPRVVAWIAAGRLTWRAGEPWFDGKPLKQPLRMEEAVP